MLINVYDLSKYISDWFFIQYADDNLFVHTGNVSNALQLIQKDIKHWKQQRYFHDNCLILSTTKTQCMFVGSRGSLPILPLNLSLNVDGTQIHLCKSMKNWEIFFDCNMTFDSHVSNITTKTYKNYIIHKKNKIPLQQKCWNHHYSVSGHKYNRLWNKDLGICQ